MPATETSRQACVVCGIHTVHKPESNGFSFPAYGTGPGHDTQGLCIDHTAQDIENLTPKGSPLQVGLKVLKENLYLAGWTIVERNMDLALKQAVRARAAKARAPALATQEFKVVKATGLLSSPGEWSSHLNLLQHEFEVGLHQGSPVGKWWVVASNAKGEKGNLRFVKPGLPGVRPLGTMTVEQAEPALTRALGTIARLDAAVPALDRNLAERRAALASESAVPGSVEAEARVTFEAAQDLSHYYKGKPEKVTFVTLDPADPKSHTHPDREGVADDPRDRDPGGLTHGQVATLRARAVAALHTYRAGLLELGAKAGADRVTNALSALGA